MKFKFRPDKKVTDSFTQWYAWFPVKISYNQFAWREIVYRRESYVPSSKRGLLQKKFKLEYISKEEFFTRAMKYNEAKDKYDGCEAYDTMRSV